MRCSVREILVLLVAVWITVLIGPMAVAQTASAVLAQIPTHLTVDSAEAYTYKRVGGTELRLYVFKPTDDHGDEPRPAIVFFFGGAWTAGRITQFVPQSHYLASRGMVAIVADYRVSLRHGSTWFESVSDAQSAVRWVREHAAELGIDPDRIVASGGSAGGQLAAAAALVEEEGPEAASVSAKPNALVLFNPALDLTAFGVPAHWAEGAEAISPTHLVRENAPPTLVMHGTADATVPFSQAEQFCSAMIEQGNRCELEAYPGRGHGFFNYLGTGLGDFVDTVLRMDAFLVSLGYLP